MDEKEAFMKDICGMSMNQLRPYVENKFQKVEQHGRYYDQGGQFLPLSVWERQGYDPEAIRTKSIAIDKQTHPVLGDTYRVCVLSSGSRGYRGSEASESMSKRPKNAKLSLQSMGLGSAASINEADTEGNEAGSDIDKSEDSSSRSDSSSSSKKKRKKSKKSNKSKKSKKKSAKKLKKEKKAAEKQKAAEKAASLKEKVAVKEKAAVDKLANAVIAKCNPVCISLSSQFSEASSAFLPAPVACDAKQKLEALQDLTKRAQLIVNNELEGSELGIAKIQALLITSNPSPRTKPPNPKPKYHGPLFPKPYILHCWALGSPMGL